MALLTALILGLLGAGGCFAVKKTVSDDEFCMLKPDTGPCRAIKYHFYYNETTAQCLEFVYGGCKGNANNFQNKESCEQACRRVDEVLPEELEEPGQPESKGGELCTLKPETGPCRAIKYRFYYNETTGQCLEFVYGGCKGNANNFQNKELCERECSRVDEVLPEELEEPGQQESKGGELCALTFETGPCRAMMQRFYFNETTGQCLEFVYGGCKGNANNFLNKESCEQACRRVDEVLPEEPQEPWQPESKEHCSLLPEAGNCLLNMTRYYFSPKLSTCQEFVYSGCPGNQNRFMTYKACMQNCGNVTELLSATASTTTTTNAALPRVDDTGRDSGDASRELCTLKPETGLCRAIKYRFYYNETAGQCLEFVYGGCKGNANNFQNKESCERKCRRVDKVLPGEPQDIE